MGTSRTEHVGGLQSELLPELHLTQKYKKTGRESEGFQNETRRRVEDRDRKLSDSAAASDVETLSAA